MAAAPGTGRDHAKSRRRMAANVAKLLDLLRSLRQAFRKVLDKVLDQGPMGMQESSYYLHQAQVCMSLARGTDDPNLKQKYEELAIDCLERLGEMKPEERNASPHELPIAS
jgi:hypothetical protein